MDTGAHVLDVCVALTERGDEAAQMREAVRKLEMGVEAPLTLDSTEASVIQAGLESYPGRAIINSINLENGRQRIEAVLPLAREHGSAVVALTIDEEGMAKTAERKVAIARRIYDIATQEYGLPPEALLFDALTFPVTTGQEELRDSAVQTLEAIRAHQGGAARRADDPGREQRFIRRRAACPRRAKQRLPLPRDAGRTGRRDRQPGAHHALH